MRNDRKKQKNLDNHLIMGRHVLEELLKYDPKRILEVYTAFSNKSGGRKNDILDELQKKHVPVRYVSPQDLFQLVGTDNHQSFVAKVKPRDYLSIEDLLAKDSKKDKVLYLMLDQIFDPQNLGTILRVSEVFGVDGVIFSKNRGSSITPVVTKTSSGASEFIPIAKVSNLATTLQKLQKEDFYVITSELSEDSQSLVGFDFPQRSVLVMGSEGKGVQPLISKISDYKVSIPQWGKIASLNVSQATSIFLYHWKTKDK